MPAQASTGRFHVNRYRSPAIVRPSRCAIAAASVRLAAFSLPRMLETCTLTVFGEMNSSAADLPVAVPRRQQRQHLALALGQAAERAAVTAAAVLALVRADPRSACPGRRARPGAAPPRASRPHRRPAATARPRPPGRPTRPAPRPAASAPARSRRRSPRRRRLRPPATRAGSLSPFARLCSASALASQPRPSTPSANPGICALAAPALAISSSRSASASTLSRRAESPLNLATTAWSASAQSPTAATLMSCGL